MKKLLLIFASIFAANIVCFAQKNISIDNVDISDANNVINSLPRNAVYTFPDFTEGKVYFKNGTTSSAKLNYNTLAEEMQFIDNSGKTLTISNADEIAYIIIADKTFYHFEGHKFAELLVNSNAILCVKRKTECTNIGGRAGAYGSTSSTTAISQVNSSVFDDKYRTLANRRDLTFSILDQFYIKKDNKFTKINNKKSIIKIFPEHKTEIEDYFTKRDINLNNEKDLIKLINFCNQLTNVKE